MSVRAMSIVWDSSLTPTSLKLTALALADWSNDEGGSLFPSIAAIAKKVGVSRCQAQRLVQSLKSAGLLSVVANAHGGAPGETPQYQLHLDRMRALTGSKRARGSTGDTGSTVETASTDETGSTDALTGVASMQTTGRTAATQTTTEPSSEPSVGRSPASSAMKLSCPVDEIRHLYSTTLPSLPAVKVWTPRRQSATKARWDDMASTRSWKTTAEGVAWFQRFFEAVSASDFLMGRSERKAGHEGWRCDFDFLMTQAKFIGVIEGKYANRDSA